MVKVRKLFKILCKMPHKPKGFYWSQSSTIFLPIYVLKEAEAVHLYATSEVKMEAKSRIFGKFWTKYCFALFQDTVWRKNEIP